ncbi:MAG TPA: peptidoglycan DD-metalloendopeptidase family protein, partial [Anaerolineales bacterium]|nr:peptidoglycan DD-metalloendopeptidase family protein [Anaerolineales bacterium]
MKSNYFLRAVSLLVLLVSLIPASNAGALEPAARLADPPPANTFQLPWDLGIAWVTIDGLDNGTRRPLNSSHHFSVGGAIDFAPHNNMRKGEDTSRFWVAAVASGTVVAKSFCHVKIDHGNGWTSEYQFLANVQVKVGDSVARNQRLGIIADGVRQKFCPGSNEPNVPHVHFMLRPTLRDATLAGWEVNYLPILSKTTFRKGGQTVGLFKPLLNTFDEIQIVMRGPITWDTLYSGTVDAFRYERWSLTLDELNKFTLTATPTATGLVPLIVLMDSNGNEIARSPGTLTSTQPAGSYFVQIQPETGSGSYNLLLKRDDLPAGPFVSTTVSPASVTIGQTATATVRLNNVPAEGYTSAEFTCTYNSTLTKISNIVTTDLFGTDPAVAINDPQNGSFIVAIAGSQGKKATTDGTAFTFSLTGLQAGQTAVECKARVSKGDNVLTAIDFIPGSLTVTTSSLTPTPGPSPTAPFETPEPTFTQSPSPNTPTPTNTPAGPTHSPTPSITPGGPTATPIPDTVYDFAANMCAATWFSGAGQLPCPGTDGDAKGFVLKRDQPQLESGAIDPRPALLTFPQNTQNGYIQGFFPPFHVESGDRFRATLSCEGGATACYVAFRLDYQFGAYPIRTLWGPFLERYEGQTYSVNIDLSPLAGEDVQFILTVLAAGQATGDRALWVGPIITRSDSVSTSTPATEETTTQTPYISPTPTSDGSST